MEITRKPRGLGDVRQPFSASFLGFYQGLFSAKLTLYYSDEAKCDRVTD